MAHKQGKGMTGKKHTKRTKQKIRDSVKQSWLKNPKCGMNDKQHTKRTKEKISNSQIKRFKKTNVWNKGLKLGPNLEHSKRMKGKKCSEETKLKMRLSAIKYVEQCKLNGMPLTPKLGINEKIILDELENVYGYKIIRQFKIKPLGYFLDGYIPELNLAIEIDESHHNKQKEKDIQRQKEIEKELNCNFIRIKDEDVIEI